LGSKSAGQMIFLCVQPIWARENDDDDDEEDDDEEEEKEEEDNHEDFVSL